MKILDKIKALLAKAESSTFEEEKETYYAKAQELMVKHAIEESDLTPEAREKIIQRTIFITASRADTILYHYVAIAHGVKFIENHHCRGSKSDRTGIMVGYPTDIDFVLSLVASLYLHRELELGRAPNPYNEHGKSFNHSFRLAFARRIYTRLVELFAQAAEHENGAVVLYNRGKEVELYVKATIKTRKTTISSNSQSGAASGREAANRASLLGARNNLSNNSQRALA